MTADQDDASLEVEEQKRAGTARFCALTRAVLPVDALIRFVAAPDGTLVPDIRNKLPGRGLWLTARRPVVEEARRRNVFARGLKREIKVPADLADQIEGLLHRDGLQMLAIANKAGAVTTGFAKIEGMSGVILALVQALDGSPSEVQRLRGLLRERGPGRRAPQLVALYRSDEIALSLGREHVIHAALKSHDASAAFLARIRRLVDFRVGDAAGPADFAGHLATDALDFSRS